MWIWSSLTATFFNLRVTTADHLLIHICDLDFFFTLSGLPDATCPISPGLWPAIRNALACASGLSKQCHAQRHRGQRLNHQPSKSTSWAFLPFLQQHWILVYQENMNLNMLGGWRAVGIDILTFFVNHRQLYLSRWRNERNRNSR